MPDPVGLFQELFSVVERALDWDHKAFLHSVGLDGFPLAFNR